MELQIKEMDDVSTVIENTKKSYDLVPEKVHKQSLELKVNDLNTIVQYGVDIEQKSAERASKMLDKVESTKVYDIETPIRKLKKETSNIKADRLIVEDQNRMVRFLKNATNSIKKELNLMNTASDKIDNIGRQLYQNAQTLKTDAALMQNMYHDSIENIKELDYLIAGADEKLESIDNELIPNKEQNIENGQSYAMQELQNLKDFKDQLLQKRQSLESTKMLQLTSIAQLSIMYRVNYSLAQQIESNVTKSITQWKEQITKALFTYKSNSSVKAANLLEEEINNQIVENAKNVYRSAVDTAEFSTHTTVKPETVAQSFKYVQKAIEDVARIQGEREKRFEKYKNENQKLINEYSKLIPKEVGSNEKVRD